MSQDTNTKQANRRTLKGTVLSTKAAKTAVVEVSRYEKHPLLGKFFTIRKKYKVHDPEEEAVVGAKVTIVETRPISKGKHFVLKTTASETKA